MLAEFLQGRTKMKKHIFSFFFFLSSFFFFLSPLSAYDFGLVINENGGFGNAVSEDNAFDYKVDILPRFSTLIGDNGEFILSAGFSIGIDQDFFYIPELLRTEFSMRFGDSGIKVGRINYTDPLSFIANGFFDGAQYYYNSRIGSFNVGAWYTGFQYKKRVNIAMTEDDQTALNTPFEYGDIDTYFASKRVVASIGWEHPSIGELVHLNTAVIGQVDLNGTDTDYHSQYVILKAAMPIDNFLFELGGSVEFSQQTVADENKFKTAFVGELGLFLLFPSKFNSRLSFTGIIASGGTNDSIGTFIPITGKEYGYILRSNITGLSIFSLNYSTKFNNFFGGSFTASYFVRNDGTFVNYPVSTDSSEYFLGPEASFRITWSPASDLQLNLGGGAFFPSLGDAGPKEDIKWRVDLSVIMSIL
jgi:hypothetical protein